MCKVWVYANYSTIYEKLLKLCVHLEDIIRGFLLKNVSLSKLIVFKTFLNNYSKGNEK